MKRLFVLVLFCSLAQAQLRQLPGSVSYSFSQIGGFIQNTQLVAGTGITYDQSNGHISGTDTTSLSNRINSKAMTHQQTVDTLNADNVTITKSWTFQDSIIIGQATELPALLEIKQPGSRLISLVDDSCDGSYFPMEIISHMASINVGGTVMAVELSGGSPFSAAGIYTALAPVAFVDNDGTGTNVGLFAGANATAGTNIGVQGFASGGSINWAGYFGLGNVYIHDKVGINVLSPDAALDIDGDLNVVNGNFITIDPDNNLYQLGDLSSNNLNSRLIIDDAKTTITANALRLVFGDSLGQGNNTLLTINDTTELVHINKFLTVDSSVGIGTAPTVNALEVNGTVNATAFTGDGSGLTNIALDDLVDVSAASPLSGDRLVWSGTAWIPSAATSVVGSASSFYLDITSSLADNFTLSTTPSSYAETPNLKAVTSATQPVFFERFISGALGRTLIPAGTWTFNIYGATSSNVGLNKIKVRVNKRVAQTGMTATYTGIGDTRTFTVSGGTPFVAGDANASRLLAGLVETPTQTSWISAFTSSSEVTVTLTDPAFVNVSGVALNAIYYYLFDDSTGDMTGSTPALYTVTSTRPAYSGLNITDRLVAAFFATNDQAGSHDLTLYYGGTQNFTYFVMPLTTQHNDLAGLNLGDYLHLTAAEYAAKITHFSDTTATLLKNADSTSIRNYSNNLYESKGFVGGNGATFDTATVAYITKANTFVGTATFSNATYSALFTGGNVGIGQTVPTARLDVKGTGTGEVLIGEWGGSAAYAGIGLANSLASGGYNLVSSPGDTHLYINRPSGKDIKFRENNSDQVIIQGSTGNVGIGTTAPAALLELRKTGGAWLRLNTGTVNHFLDISNIDDGANFYHSIAPGSVANAPIVFYSPGNASSVQQIWLRNPGGNYYGMRLGHNDTYGSIQNDSSTPLALQPSGGNVGIGTTTQFGAEQLGILAADNGTVLGLKINATQANVTAADIFAEFRSTTGVEGSIAGTATGGLIAYNTFTGAHYAEKQNESEPMVGGMIVSATGAVLQGGQQLAVITKSSGRADKKVYGVFSGKIADGLTQSQIDSIAAIKTRVDSLLAVGTSADSVAADSVRRTIKLTGLTLNFSKGNPLKGLYQVFAVGTGIIAVNDSGGNISVGDLIESSPVAGFGERQPDDIVHSYTVAKATQAVDWSTVAPDAQGRKKKQIACVYKI